MSHLTMVIALPSVINLPDDRYTVVVENGRQHILELSNQMWALRTQIEFKQDLVPPGHFGTQHQLELIIRSGSVSSYTTEKLCTWLQEEFQLPADVDANATGDIASREHYGFLSAVNLLIEAYRVVRHDPFVHPVSPARCVVYAWADLGTSLIQLPVRIGKIPPHLCQPWMPNASDDQMQEFRDFIGGSKPLPFHHIQLIQARAHIERNDTRAAIMEVRGAFENAIAAKIAGCLRVQGHNETHVEDWLEKHDGFKDRWAKLARLTGRTLRSEDKALDDRLLHWRDTLRHLVIHADRIPDVRDAQNACADHERAVNWVDDLT